ncbi:Dynein regulatory complex protein 1, partial [Orchesella cincta]
MSRVSKVARKLEEEQNIDETVTEFLHARQDRIRQRRARIADKIALKKKNDEGDTGSIASSLDFVTGENKSTAGSGGESGSKDGSGKSKTKKDGSPGDPSSSQDLKKSTVDSLDVQIEESRKQLEQIILDGESLITNVRIAAECREKLRHTKQTENRKERLDRLRQESQECQELYEDLKPNWDLKGEKILPLDLHAKIKSQQNACDDLLQKKQDLIISLQREIEENDFDYETNLEMYQKDVSLMGDRIDDGVDDLQSAFLNELNLIEDYTCRNREVLLEENQREWMDLLEDFETMEEGHLEERKKDALNKFQILNEMYISVKQECRAMRHKFEDDLRILIQELEQIKYATQLNMEKLQYNLAIIRKRFKENVEMKNMMKRLLLKFNDRFTNKSRQLKAKMEAGRKEAKKILNDIEKLEESVQNFGRKTLHLVVSDYNKYMDLWIISEEIVRERLQKLL